MIPQCMVEGWQFWPHCCSKHAGFPVATKEVNCVLPRRSVQKCKILNSSETLALFQHYLALFIWIGCAKSMASNSKSSFYTTFSLSYFILNQGISQSYQAASHDNIFMIITDTKEPQWTYFYICSLLSHTGDQNWPPSDMEH